MGEHRSGRWVISPLIPNAAGGPHIHIQTLGVLPLADTCRDSKYGRINFGYEVRRDEGFELSHCICALPEAAVPWPSPKGRQWWTRGVGGAPVKSDTESAVHVIAKHLHLLENILVFWKTRFRGGAAMCGAKHHPCLQELLSSKVALRGQRPRSVWRPLGRSLSFCLGGGFSVKTGLQVGRRGPASHLHSPLCVL